METVFVNRGFLSVGVPASEEERLLEEVEDLQRLHKLESQRLIEDGMLVAANIK